MIQQCQLKLSIYMTGPVHDKQHTHDFAIKAFSGGVNMTCLIIVPSVTRTRAGACCYINIYVNDAFSVSFSVPPTKLYRQFKKTSSFYIYSQIISTLTVRPISFCSDRFLYCGSDHWFEATDFSVVPVKSRHEKVGDLVLFFNSTSLSLKNDVQNVEF